MILISVIIIMAERDKEQQETYKQMHLRGE